LGIAAQDRLKTGLKFPANSAETIIQLGLHSNQTTLIYLQQMTTSLRIVGLLETIVFRPCLERIGKVAEKRGIVTPKSAL